MILKLQKLEKLINSELSSKIQSSSINNDELLVEIGEVDLFEVVQFLKSNENCKFKQLIDIAGVDYPENEKRFELVYLLLSHEYNTSRSRAGLHAEDKLVPGMAWREQRCHVDDSHGARHPKKHS